MKNFFLFFKNGLGILFQNKWQLFFISLLTFLIAGFFAGGITTILEINENNSKIAQKNNNYLAYSNQQIFGQTKTSVNQKATNQINFIADLLPSYFLRTHDNITTPFLETNPNVRANLFNNSNLLSLNPFFKFINFQNWKQYWSFPQTFQTPDKNYNYNPLLIRYNNGWNTQYQISNVDNNRLIWASNNFPIKIISKINGFQFNKFEQKLNSIIQTSIFNALNNKTNQYLNDNLGIARYSLIFLEAQKKYQALKKIDPNNLALKNQEKFFKKNNILSNYINSIANCMSLYINQELINWVNNLVVSLTKQQDKNNLISDIKNGDGEYNYYKNKALPFFIHDFSTSSQTIEDNAYNYTSLSQVQNLWEHLSYSFIFGLDGRTTSYPLPDPANAAIKISTLSRPIFQNNIYDPNHSMNNVIINNVGVEVTKNFITTNTNISCAQQGSKGLFYKIYKKNSKSNQIKWSLDNSSQYLFGYANYKYWFMLYFKTTILDHYALIADLNDLKYHYFFETIYTDNYLKKTFVVKTITDSMEPQQNNAIVKNATFENNLIIYQGIHPNEKNQVVISPEFSHKNNFGLNQSVDISSHIGLLKIVGVGLIPLDFFPGVNSQINLNSEDNGIIYADSQTVFDIFLWQKIQSAFLQGFFSIKNNAENKTTSLLNLKAFLKSNPDAMQDSLAYIKNNYVNNENQKFNQNQLDPNNVYQDFSTSTYNEFNNIVWNKVYFGFALVFAIIFAFSFITYLISTYFVSNQNIKNQSKQIGIVKSLGTKNIQILGIILPILIFVIMIIPIGWIAGIGLQTIIIRNFSVFYALQINSIYVSIYSLLLTFAFTLIPLIIFLLGSILLILRKNIYKINNVNFSVSLSNLRINEKVNTFISKQKFRVKLFINIFTMSLYKIILIGIVIFLASIIISASLFIPNALSTMANSYFKASKFDNHFDYNSPSFNNPVSKIALNIWPKTKTIDQFYKVDQKDPSKNNFKNLNDFFLFNSNSSAVPPYVKLSNSQNWYWTPQALTKLNPSELEVNLINLLSSNFNFANSKNFSIADIDYLLKYMQDPNTPNKTAKTQCYDNLNLIVNKIVPQILRSIFVYYTQAQAKSWKDDINNIILSTLPQYVTKYITSPFKKEIFSFGWNNTTYIPGYDDLSTQIKTQLWKGNKKNSKFNIDGFGLEKTQKSIEIDPSLNNILYGPMDQKALQELSDPSKNKATIIVPIVVSKKAQIVNKLSINQILNSTRTTQTIMYNDGSNNFYPINPKWWIYDDSSYGKDLFDNSKNNDKILLSNLDISRFHSGSAYSNNKDITAQEGFTQVAQINNQFKEQTRPYYNWENVELLLPASGPHAINIDFYKQEANNFKTDFKSDQTFNLGKIPIESYPLTSKNNQEFYVLHPFSFSKNSQFTNQPLSTLVTPLINLYDRFSENNVLKTDSYPLNNIPSSFFSNYNLNLNNANIEYKIVGVNNVYDNSSFYLDQNLANKILGFPNTLTNQYNYKIFSKNNATGQIDKFNSPKTTSFSKTDLKIQDPNNLPHAWFNTKFSNVQTPYDISSNISLRGQNGNDSIYWLSHFENLLVNKIDLFSHRVHFIITAAEGALTITTILIGSSFICAIILSFLIFEMFVDDFRKFMILMRAEGYKISEILNNTVTIFLPIILLTATLGYLLVYFMINLTIKILSNQNIFLYYGFQLWTILVTLGIILFIYLAIWLIARRRLKKFDFKEIQVS